MTPDLLRPECWRPADDIQDHAKSVTMCHFKDIERGWVVPKYSGQVFYFADYDSYWVYIEPTPEPVRSSWGARFIIILCLVLLVVDVVLITELIQRLQERGML